MGGEDGVGGGCPVRPAHPGFGLGDVAMLCRAKAMSDPLFFGSEIIGRELLRFPSSAHREVAQALKDQADLLYVDHRGTLKTTLLHEIGDIWQFAAFPEDRLLFLQSSLDNAKALSRQIRQHYVSNVTLRTVFPEYAMASVDDGSVQSWSHPCKRTITREGSFEIGTPGTALAGRHYEIIAASDLCNEQTVPPPCGRASPELMKSIISWYATADGLLVSKAVCKRAHRRQDSNRWADGDIAGTIIREDSQNTIRKVVRGVTRDAEGKFVPTWDMIPREELEKIRARPTMTAAVWAANYCSDPMPEGGVAFQREFFRYYTDAPKGLSIAITVDPAFTEASSANAAKSDRSAIVVSGIDPVTKNLYVLQTKAGRWSPYQLVEQLFTLSAFWRPRWVGIEETTGSKALIAILLSEMTRTGRMVPYRKMKLPGLYKNSSKEARIGPLHAHAEHFGIYVKKHEHDDLVEELMRFMVSEKDDLADALAYRAMDLYAPGTMAMEPKDEQRKRPSSMPSAIVGREAIERQMERARRGHRYRPWAQTMKELRA